MRYRIFISHSAKDAMLAEDLRRRLKDAGVDFVITADTEDAAPGHLRRTIRDAINKSSEVIALLTDNSLNSKWVLYEVGVADSLERPVTFVVVNEGVERQLPVVGRKFIRYTDLPDYLSSLKERAEAA